MKTVRSIQLHNCAFEMFRHHRPTRGLMRRLPCAYKEDPLKTTVIADLLPSQLKTKFSSTIRYYKITKVLKIVNLRIEKTILPSIRITYC